MRRYGPHKLSIEIEVAKPPVFAIANQQQGLIVPLVDREPMAAIELSFRVALLAIAGLELALAVEPKNTRIAIAIRNENRSIRGRHRCGYPPFVWRLEAGLGGRGDLLNDAAVRFHFYEEPIFRRRSLLHRAVEILDPAFLRMNHGMDFGETTSDRLDQGAVCTIHKHSGFALRADVSVPCVILRNRAMRSAERGSLRKLAPGRDNAICEFTISGQDF